MGRSRGSILVMALWALSILTIFALMLGSTLRQKLTLGNRLDTYETLQAAALAGIEAGRGIAKQSASGTYDDLKKAFSLAKEQFRQTKIGDAYFSLADKEGFTDEESKININTAEVQTLQSILQSAAGLDKDAAEDIAYSIIDWRDSDSIYEHPDHGAENDYYENLPLPYSAKNAPFEAMDELLLVKGINRAIFDKLKPFLTLVGKGVNVNTAPKEVLMALGLSEATADKIIRHRAGADGISGTADDIAFIQAASITNDLDRDTPPLARDERALLENLIAAEKIGASSAAFTVTSRAWMEGRKVSMQVEAVMDVKGKIYYLRSSGVQWPSKVSA